MATRNASLRRTLLIGILVPIALFIVVNSASLYRQSLVAATTAYDRLSLFEGDIARKLQTGLR